MSSYVTPQRAPRYGSRRSSFRSSKHRPVPVRTPKAPRKRVGAKVRVGTRTMTKTHRRATALPNRAGTESRLVIKLKPVGLLNKVQGKLVDQTYNINQGLVVANGIGLQQFASPMALFQAVHLRSMMTASLHNTGATVGLTELNLFVKSAFYELAIQNSSNAVIRIQIWDNMCRRDSITDENGNVINPEGCFLQGLKDQTNSGTGTEYRVVGARPTDSTIFNQYYKVKRVTYTDLAPGQVHYHRIHYKIMRKLNNQVVEQGNNAINGVKGWTIYPTILSYGEPVGDGSGGCTTEAGRLNCVASITYHYTYLLQNLPYSVGTNNLGTSTTGNLENLVTGAAAGYAAVT